MFKTAFIALLTALNFSDWAAKVEASSDKDVPISAEELQKITAEVEGFKKAATDAETSLSDSTKELNEAKENLEKTTNELTALKADKEKVDGELATANANLKTANERVAELEAAAGEDPTDGGKKDPEAKDGTPAWLDTNAAHYKDLQAAGIEVFK